MNIKRVEPIGMRTARGFACRADGSSAYEWETPEYPPSQLAVELRVLRVACKLSLGEAARILGLTVEELSGLEMGRYTTDDTAEIFSKLSSHKRED